MSAININSVEFNFENHNVRIVIIENSPWFVAVDICNVLGIQNPTKALKSLDDEERSNFKLGRQGDANIISESGMYTLVLRCRDAIKKGTLPHRFRKWVTGEVLPAIRKTGRYESTPIQHHQNREPIDNNDLANIKWLINCITNRFKYKESWNQGIWYALRRATGTTSPNPFSVEDIPILAAEFTRIMTVTSSASDLICTFEKEVLKQVLRNRKDYDSIASQFTAEFKSLQASPQSTRALERFEQFGLARLTNRSH